MLHAGSFVTAQLMLYSALPDSREDIDKRVMTAYSRKDGGMHFTGYRLLRAASS